MLEPAFSLLIFQIHFVVCKIDGFNLNYLVKDVDVLLPFTTQYQLLTTLKKKHSENILWKGENAGNQH